MSRVHILLSADFLIGAGRWDLVFISVIFFAAFLLFIGFRKKASWRTHGTYMGFIIALFAEMFGFPLTIYFISSYFVRIHFDNQFLNYMNSLGMSIGIIITFIGALLVIAGWKLIYKSREDIAINGIYGYIRQPYNSSQWLYPV